MSRRAAGFTLLEVIVSLVLLAAGLVAVVSAFNVSLAATGAADRRTLATTLLNEKVEELKKEPLLTAGQNEGDFGEDFEDYQWRLEISESGTPGLVFVVVTVSWPERGKPAELFYRLLMRGGEAVQQQAQEQAGNLAAQGAPTP